MRRASDWPRRPNAIDVATIVERLETRMGNIAPAHGDEKSILSQVVMEAAGEIK